MSPSDRPSRRRRRWPWWFAGALLALLTVPAAALLILANSEAGRQAVAQAIERAVSSPGQSTLAIGRIDGSLLGEFAIDSVAMGDARGPWLRLDGVRVAWSPLALLGGTLAIDAVELERIAVARPPLPTGEASAAGPPPSLPLDVAVRRVAVAHIELGEPVLGVPAAFTVEGELSGTPPQTVAARFAARRIDGVDGALTLDASLRGTDRFLSVKLEAHEPAGGLLARLLQLPDLPALDATLDGQGPADDWRGKLDFALDGLYRAQATLLLADAAAPTLTIDGSGRAARGFEAPPWALLNGTTSVRLTAQWQPEAEVVTLRALDVTGAAWRATASGSFDVPKTTGRVTAEVAITDAEALAPLAGGTLLPGLTAQLDARGGLDQVAATLRLDAPTVRQGEIEAGAVSTDVQVAGPAAGPLRIEAKGRIGSIAAPDLPPAYAEGGVDWQVAANVALDGPTVAIDTLRLDGRLARIDGTGRLDLASGDIATDLAIAVPDLALLAPLDGTATVRVSALASELGQVFAADIDGRVDATSAEPAIAAALGGGATLWASLNGSLDGDVSVHGLSVATPTVRLDAAANLGAGFSQVNARYDIAVADLSKFAPVAGRVRVEGTAQGPLDALAAEGRVRLADLAVEGQQVPTATVDYKLAGLPAAPRGGISAMAETPVGAVTARTALAQRGDDLQLSGIQVAAERGGRITGDLRLSMSGAPAAGALRVEAAQLGPLLALAGLAGDGRAGGTVTLADIAGRQGAGIDAEVSDFSLDLDGETLAIASVALKVDGADLVQQRVENLALTVGNASLGERRVDRLNLNATGTPTAMRFDLHADGDVFGALDLDAAGEVALDGAAVMLTLASLDGTVAGETVTLTQPATVQSAPDRLALDGLDLRLGPARLAGEAVVGRDEVAIDLALSDLDFGKLKRRVGATGRVAAAVRVDGVGAAQRGTITVSARDVGVAELPEAGPAAADIEGTLAGGWLRVDGKIDGLGSNPFAFTGALPLALGGPDLVALAPDVPIEGAATWQGEVGELWLFVPLPTHLLSGQATVDARVGGTLAAPRLDGSASLTGGRYESLDAGTIVTDLDVLVSLAGDRIVLERFSGTDGESGKLTAEGSVELPRDGQALKAALRATLANFTAVRRDELVGSLGGETNVTLDGEAAQVTARLRTETVEVRIPDRLPLQVADLEVRDAAAPPPKEAPPPPIVAGLDVAAELPRRVYVRGRGLDSEWEGKVTVTGTSAAPDVRGELRVVRGSLSLLGKDFELTEGRVLLPGGPTPDPQINVAATHQADDLEVVVKVTGSAANPDFTLTSSPALPQDEILAQLFFGKSATQLSALEAAQLASGIAELTGVTSGPSLIDRLRTSLGIDVLKVEGGAGGPSRVAAGAYVADKVLVGVKQGAAAGSGAVSVEVEVTDYLSLESEVEQSGASSMGVKVEWDY
jgi:translocation and assembly module TamB